jgi:succinyl-CoA synthetase beta subunit
VTVPKLLSPVDARRDLAASGIPFSDWRVVRTTEEAREAATAVGFPVVLKAASDRVAHKSEAGLVEVGIPNQPALADAVERMMERLRGIVGEDPGPLELTVEAMEHGEIELLAGVRRDPVFGPVLAVGLGGTAVEVHRDVALRVLPVSGQEVHVMLRELRSHPLLVGYRNSCPVDTQAFARIALALAHHILTKDDVLEIDLNPVLVRCSGGGAVAVDARVIVNPGSTSVDVGRHRGRPS